MSAYIPLCVPSLNGNELKYVKECIDTEWVSSAGKYVDLFEQKIAEFTGSKYAVACVNGTAAIQVSLRLAGVKPGDEVIVPTLTFIASINAVAYNNATPIFVDADKYGLSRDSLYEKLKQHNIFARRYFYPLISQFPTYRGLESAQPGKLPVAEKAADQVICLPLYPELQANTIDSICSFIKK